MKFNPLLQLHPSRTNDSRFQRIINDERGSFIAFIAILNLLLLTYFPLSIPNRSPEKIARYNTSVAAFNALPYDVRQNISPLIIEEKINQETYEIDLIDATDYTLSAYVKLFMWCEMIILIFSTVVTSAFIFREYSAKICTEYDGYGGEIAKYFIADLPFDSRRANLKLLAFTFAGFPCYLVSWIRLRQFRKLQATNNRESN